MELLRMASAACSGVWSSGSRAPQAQCEYTKSPCLPNYGILQSVHVSIETQCYVKDLQLCSDRSDIQSSWLGTFISIHRQNFSVICEMWMASGNDSAPFVALSWALLKCHSLPTAPPPRSQVSPSLPLPPLLMEMKRSSITPYKL